MIFVLSNSCIDRHTDSNPDKHSFYTSLHLASTHGHLTVAELLIQNGVNVNSRNQNQETALHVTSHNGHLKIAQLLLTSGSDINSRDGQDSTPLHKAAQRGYLDIVKLLLNSGADVNIRDSNDANALDMARQCGSVDVAKFLAERMGANDSHFFNNLAHLDSALQEPLPKATQPSIGVEGCENRRYKGTSLHTASEEGDVEAVRSLLGGGADINER